ncbi:MAG: hypothetical protein ACQETQ_04370 [Spirochaetota bacterium]
MGFGTLLLRAVVGALVFGALGYGAYILISTRLPELLSQPSTSQTEEASAAAGYGQNVDIVVDDESEGGLEDTADNEASDLEEVDEPASAAGEAAAPGAPGTADTPEAADAPEVVEPASAAGEAAAPGAPGTADTPEAADAPGSQAAPATDDGLVEEVEEVAEAAPETPNAASGEDDMNENSVDTLPDIGSFAGDFESEGNEVVEDAEQTGTTGGGERASGSGVQQDPEVIAKALQTVMKRDE